ncbi:MAG TPA: hypothetical protein VGM90_26865 [Kofleriaceae bacterium]
MKRWFSSGPSGDEKKLLHRCLGDVAQADRLISAELARRPALSRAAASRSALDRWSRDR